MSDQDKPPPRLTRSDDGECGTNRSAEALTRLAAAYRELVRHMTPEQLDHAEECNACTPGGAALTVLIEQERADRAQVAR